MKTLLLFCTKFRYFLTEIPPIILLILAIKFNNTVKSPMRLYPLIITISAAIVFIAVYFFRCILIRKNTIKCVGLFSSRESIKIEPENFILITLLPKRKIKLEVYGDVKDFDTYKWLKDDKPSVINIFRAKALGGKNTARRILKFFKIPTEDTYTIIENVDFLAEYEKVKAETYISNENFSIKITLKENI